MSVSDSGGTVGGGSLERGLAGDYQIEVGEVLREAWAKTDGSKATFFIALVIYLAIVSAVGFVVGIATAVFDRVGLDVFDVLDQLVPVVIAMPMVCGITVLGLRRSVGVETSPGIVLSYFHLWIPVVVLTVIMYVLVAVGLALLVIPGIYLAVSYMLAIPLLVDKKLEPWEALETSRRALSTHWFEMLAFALAVGFINLATIVTLGIGLIWTFPMSYIAIGLIYQRIFGIEPETLGPA